MFLKHDCRLILDAGGFMRYAIHRLMLAALFVLASIAVPAFAAEPYVDIEQRLSPEQMKATGLDQLTSEQLALLNRLLREQRSVAADAARAEAKPEASAQTETRRAEAAPSGGREADVPVGLIDGPIRGRIAGDVTGWAPGDVFTLENGQQWKVLKGSMRLRKPLKAPEIKIVPGISGNWFLQFDEDLPKARVYRID